MTVGRGERLGGITDRVPGERVGLPDQCSMSGGASTQGEIAEAARKGLTFRETYCCCLVGNADIRRQRPERWRRF